MPQRTDDGHQWVGAASIPLPQTQVRMAHKRGTYRIPDETKVDIAEVYCSACHRGYDRAAGKPCEALVSRKHLIGGPVEDTRTRRVPTDLPDAHAV